jgi:hypothetical protein
MSAADAAGLYVEAMEHDAAKAGSDPTESSFASMQILHAPSVSQIREPTCPGVCHGHNHRAGHRTTDAMLG